MIPNTKKRRRRSARIDRLNQAVHHAWERGLASTSLHLSAKQHLLLSALQVAGQASPENLSFATDVELRTTRQLLENYAIEGTVERFGDEYALTTMGHDMIRQYEQEELQPLRNELSSLGRDYF
ncbi:hypothetical protein Pan216_42360 [Planctomycetes bacterium Pan216]|uniref:ArnR1-like winged helix-turn-helix domain-containing protein n=1 Tax=Kolteria novifilia TaxID=2527975 RepID=A0A518B8R0_9BACT|nr:hypothetical protein Pan216_42360 [Planctomycetes bacterium Pan216]